MIPSGKYFKSEELIRHTHPAWEYDEIVRPPASMAENILPTLRMADMIRDRWGGPVLVISGYRCPAYNRFVVDGADDSQHMYFRALDLMPMNREIVPFKELVDKIVRHLRSNEEWPTIGYGRYDTFVHIDTNHPTPNRNWFNNGG